MADPRSLDQPGGPGLNSGHGHVWPRPDRSRARCGGPGLCRRCAADAARKAADATLPAATAQHHRTALLRLSHELADDASFVTGVSWGVKALDRVLAALDGETDRVVLGLDDAPADAPPKPPARPVPARVTVDPSMLVWAFRYALGRRTYAPSDVAQALLEHRAALGALDRRLIVEDIRAAIREGTAGAGCDVDVWEGVADALTEVPA